jgi:hypothetical protein
MTKTYGSTWGGKFRWTTIQAETLAVMHPPEKTNEPDEDWVPNDVTLAAMRDAERGENLVRFDSADAFFAELNDGE